MYYNHHDINKYNIFRYLRLGRYIHIHTAILYITLILIYLLCIHCIIIWFYNRNYPVISVKIPIRYHFIPRYITYIYKTKLVRDLGIKRSI